MTKNNGNNFGTLLTGALLGAAAVILTDRKKRKKVMSYLEDKKEEGQHKLDGLKEKAREMEIKAERKLEDKLDETKQNVRERRLKQS